MATRSYNQTKAVITAFLFAAGMFFNIEALTLVNEASAQALPTGCATPGDGFDSTSGFDANDLDLIGTAVDGVTQYITLDTGASALDVSNIIIPFDQDVYTTFIMEGAWYESDFGWFVKQEAEDKINGGTPISGSLTYNDLATNNVEVHWLFRNLIDDDAGCCDGGDGILDSYYDDTRAYLGDTVGLTEAILESYGFSPIYDSTPATVEPSDMRKFMGKIASGTEIVFFLQAIEPVFDTILGTYYSKNNWSSDTWAAASHVRAFDLADCAWESGCGAVWDGASSPYTTGWLGQPAIDRLGTDFGVTMTGTKYIKLINGATYNHFIVGSPPADPFIWILGVEDLDGGGDGDFNDLTFLIQRKTGGSAALKTAKSLSPRDATPIAFPDAFITSASINVTDNMPCDGDTEIRYYVSPDNGGKWTEITDWLVYTTSGKTTEVGDWSFGLDGGASQAVTYREATVSFTSLGFVGQDLIWKADLTSEDDACIPEVREFNMTYTAADNQIFSRSAPVIMTNVIFNASFETPDPVNWPADELELRGHFKAETIYDPTAPTSGFNVTNIWASTDPNYPGDAGVVLNSDITAPSDSKLITPGVTLNVASSVSIGTGDGTTGTFSGTFGSAPIAYSTISITDGTETFTDKLHTTLEGSLTGSGTINRFTGEYSVTFNTAPGNGVSILADYTSYSFTGGTVAFSTMTSNDLALDDSQLTDSTGTNYVYDFNGDGSFTTADGTWLNNWVLGFKDGASTKKAWLLPQIDHSAPAIVGAPGIPPWYNGSDVSDEVRDSFDQFRCNQRARNTVAYISDRMGQLHAFDAGKWHPYYIDETGMASDLIVSGGTECGGTNPNNVEEKGLDDYLNNVNPNGTVGGYTTPAPSSIPITIKRGYFEWPDATGPDYGDGSEIWSIMPTDLVSKLKNNKLNGDDRAALDASPAVAHVQFADGSWHTVLITAEGNGGDHILALDITNESATPTLLWSFADPDLYRSRSSPSIGSIGRVSAGGSAKWVIFFVSGVNKDNTAYPKIYMVDVESDGAGNPANVETILLDSQIGGIGGTPSGQPAVIDSDGNGLGDRLYIGTDKGYMYKVSLPDNPDQLSGAINECVFKTTNPLQPIQASPAAVSRTSIGADGEMDYSVIVLFGTGDSPYYSDDGSDQYYFYAVEDTDAKGGCTAGVDKWAPFALPAGHRIFAAAFATAETVYFGTSSSETEDPCSPTDPAATSTGMIYAIDIDTGNTSLAEEVGNITTTPVVDDEHLYVKTGSGQLMGFGGNTFQNDVRETGVGSASIKVWRQIN